MIVENIKKAEEMLQQGGLAPRDLAELRSQLSAEYSFILGQLEIILSRKPAIWNVMRKECKSDKQAEQAYSATDDGIKEMGLRLRAKRAEKLLSAIGSLLRLAENEVRNLV